MKRLYFLALSLIVFASCQPKEEKLSEKSVFDSNQEHQTELDKYIYENFQKPFNIKVTYKWIDSDFEQAKYLYPPSEDKVKPLLEIIKKVWIEPYIAVAGQNFIKMAAPRQISLVGGYNVNTNGTITLGFADSGMKITLFNVDQLDTSNEKATRRYFETIQHEYCHIVNQRKPFKKEEFGTINPEGFTSQWYNVSNADALASGFITPYAKLNEDEDFAEMVSKMLSGSKADFDAIINSAPTKKAKEQLRKKEELVVQYFKDEWGLDIYKLQELVEQNMQQVLTP